VTAARRRLRHTRLWLQALVATVVIVAAIVVGVMQLAVLPWLAAHPQRIGEFLGERLHRPVQVDRVDARWERNGPLLDLHGIHIGVGQPGQPALLIARAGLKVNLLAFAHRNARWNEFRLDGLDLNLLRDAEGHWQLSGLAAGDSSDSADQRSLFDLGALVLRNLTVSINDAGSGQQFRFAAEELRLINAGDQHRLAARVRCLQTRSAPIDTVIEYNSASDTGLLYAGGDSLELGAILHGYPLYGATVMRGAGRAQVWAHWHAGVATDARLEVGVSDLLLEAQTPIELDDKRQVTPRLHFDDVAFGARWIRAGAGWSADIDDLKIGRQGIAFAAAGAHLEKRAGDDNAPPAYVARLRNVDIATPASLAMLVEDLPAALRRWLYVANPEGDLQDADLRWNGAGDFDVAARFDAVAWRALDAIPGVSGLRGSLRGDDQALAMELPQRTSVSIEEPRVFRRAFDFSEFAGTLVAYRTDEGWRLETDALDFDGAGYAGELRGAMQFGADAGRPLVDASAVVAHASVPASHLFWPINVMPPAAVSWLDRALVSGRVSGGRAAIRGDLDDWPFRAYTGRFDAHAEVDDVTLKYLPDWPAAEHIRAAAEFVNTGLHVEVEAAQTRGNRITHASADIADLGEAVLELDASGQGSGADLLGFVKATPIGLRFGTQLLGVDVGGQGKVDFKLHAPIKQPDQLALTGTAMLADADLSDAKYDLHLNHANGKVRFTQAGFSADDLAVTMQEQPATFALAVGAFAANPPHAVEASLSARLPASKVLAYAPALSAYAAHIDGSSNWSASFSADSGDEAPQQLLVTSDLRGIGIDLPAPLAKPAASTLPLKLALGLPLAGGSVDLRLGDLLHLRGHLASLTTPFAARVTFAGSSDQAPPKSGLVVAGHVPALDLSGWMDFATADASGDGATLGSADVQADMLGAWGRDFGAAHFTLAHAADGLDLGFNGVQIDGTLHLPLADLHKHGVTAQFAHLYWPEVEASEEDAAPPSSDENPAALPPLHIHVADFRLGKENFGETSVETYPVEGGAHFEPVRAHSSNIDFRGRGDWTGRAGADRSRFTIELSAHNTGHMLDAFGYAGVIDGGETVAHIDGSWAGAPSSFALSRLDGTLKVSLKNGRIPDADFGAKRVLGLFNLAAIPRRLAFDWGDLFKTGFSFDSIEGAFTLKDGDAYTDDLLVRSPTADMRLKGRMGLKQKDWDQTIEVTPHVGGTLAVGGALIGGPVGAAAGMLLQGVFRNQINSVARAQYKVTGSWENPKVTVLAKETRKGRKAAPRRGEAPRPDEASPPADVAAGHDP
jgi:uncharacterized protein (TIGR02099 family)